MKYKYIIHNKYPLLLLFSVVILFSILGSFHEGFDDMAVPSCKTGECDDDDYILKSQIVPPVCPACPDFIGPSEKTKDKSKKVEKTTSKDNKLNYTFKQTTETDTTPQATNSNILDNLFNTGTSSGTTGTSLGTNTGNVAGTENNFGNSFNQASISEYNDEIKRLKQQLSELKTFDGVCPPCPACERCPEPSFDCKKVPNYRSTSVGDYLPIPVLNDFSKFS
jgi:hypothetical protein